ncbi:ribosome recycling factor [Peptostreptococcaceae bacterium oral taxon 113 str. W5053]|nr:ribosome recycling factor [Peptostreptococcaceae bacterium oral taxon 113 str. W5053]
MTHEVIKALEAKAGKTITYLKEEFAKVRAGRANPNLLDGIVVECYGTQTPLNQIASVSVPEARMLLIQPWDSTLIKDIEKSILRSDIGITPSNDGKVIRLPFPPLTEERRKDLVKSIWSTAETNKVAIRNARREAIDTVKKLEKEGELREDDSKTLQEEVQKSVDKLIEKIENITKEKEKELMEI